MDIARSKPDGYSLMCTGVSTVVVNPLLSKSIPYDVRKDFEPIAGIGGAGFFVLVNNANKAKNVKDMVAIAKSAAQPMRVGTLSPLGIIAYGLLQKAMGVELSRVPYSAGYAGLIPDLARGDLDIVIEAIPGAINHVNNNTVSVLGVTTAQRSAAAPDLPTFVEQGFDVNISGFTAFFAPAGVPADILATLERASLEALKDQELTKRFEAMATATLPIGGKQVGELITNSTREWAPIVDRLGLKQD